jgi:hypothetical protein
VPGLVADVQRLALFLFGATELRKMAGLLNGIYQKTDFGSDRSTTNV